MFRKNQIKIKNAGSVPCIRFVPIVAQAYHTFARSATSLGASPHRLCEAQHCLPQGNLVLCPLKRNDVILRINDVASKLANDVVSCGHKHKNKSTSFEVLLFLVPLTGLEPVRYCYRGILSPLCLPIPPQRREQ